MVPLPKLSLFLHLVASKVRHSARDPVSYLKLSAAGIIAMDSSSFNWINLTFAVVKIPDHSRPHSKCLDTQSFF